jgi:D-glycero-D-manno-heptose 1,7-bisphosphate phosphatase
VQDLVTDLRLVFLDRDGVVNRKPPEDNYIVTWEQFEFLPNAPEAIARLNRAGVKVVVVTNQRGVALGRLTERDLMSIHQKMERVLQTYDAHIDGIFFCPHDGDVCGCRKPKPGLLLQALARFSEIQPANGVLIGDSLPDVEAGRSAGVKTILVRGDAAARKPGFAEAEAKADAVVDSLPDAVSAVLGFT